MAVGVYGVVALVIIIGDPNKLRNQVTYFLVTLIFWIIITTVLL